MLWLRSLSHLLFGLLCVLSLMACGGGGSASEAPKELTFELYPLTRPVQLIGGEAAIALSIPRPGGLVEGADTLVVRWDTNWGVPYPYSSGSYGPAHRQDYESEESTPISRTTRWPLTPAHTYLDVGRRSIVVQLRSGGVTVGRAIHPISVRRTWSKEPRPPIADWHVEPAPVDGVIRGVVPFELTIDPRCSSDLDSELLHTGSYRTDAGEGEFAMTPFPFVQRDYRVGLHPFTLTVIDEDGLESEPVSVMVDLERGPSGPPVICGFWDPPAIDGVVTGMLPFSPDLNLSCSADIDSDLRQSGTISIEFGDGPRRENEPFRTYVESMKKRYTTPGTYIHTVIITDSDGLESEPFITVIQVLPPSNQLPVAIMGTDVSGGPAPLTVQFSSAGSFDPDGSIINTIWNFGDPGADRGGVSIISAPTYVFESPGVYKVTLLIIDNSRTGYPWDRDTATTTIEVTR